MYLKQMLEKMPLDILEEQCDKLWKEKGVYFSVLALSKLRDELLNTLDAKSVPCTFLVFPFKEDETEGDEEVISKDTLRSIVVFNEEIEELCEKYGRENLVKNLKNDIAEIDRFLAMNTIPETVEDKDWSAFIPDNHLIYDVHWDMLSNMQIFAADKAVFTPQQGRILAAVLYEIYETGYTKDSFLEKSKVQREMTEFLSSLQNESPEEYEEDFSEEEKEIENRKIQEEYRRRLYNLKGFMGALVQMLSVND